MIELRTYRYIQIVDSSNIVLDWHLVYQFLSESFLSITLCKLHATAFLNPLYRTKISFWRVNDNSLLFILNRSSGPSPYGYVSHSTISSAGNSRSYIKIQKRSYHRNDAMYPSRKYVFVAVQRVLGQFPPGSLQHVFLYKLSHSCKNYRYSSKMMLNLKIL